jgi:hypothetical protein
VNHAGRDILSLGIMVKSRTCLKLILDKLIEAKAEDTLARLPIKHDRFLHNLLKMTRDFDDLVAHFLSNFGLDDADPVVGERCTQLQLASGSATTAGSLQRAPPQLWAKLYEQGESRNCRADHGP